jgi:hypothetical protein
MVLELSDEEELDGHGLYYTWERRKMHTNFGVKI